jgi:hypothetical protein
MPKSKFAFFIILTLLFSNCGRKKIENTNNGNLDSNKNEIKSNIKKTKSNEADKSAIEIKTINSKSELYSVIGVDSNYFWENEDKKNQTYSIIFFNNENFIFQLYHMIGNKKHLRICELQKAYSNSQKSNIEYEGNWVYRNNKKIECQFSFMGFECSFSNDYSKMTTSRGETFVRSKDN